MKARGMRTNCSHSQTHNSFHSINPISAQNWLSPIFHCKKKQPEWQFRCCVIIQMEWRHGMYICGMSAPLTNQSRYNETISTEAIQAMRIEFFCACDERRWLILMISWPMQLEWLVVGIPFVRDRPYILHTIFAAVGGQSTSPTRANTQKYIVTATALVDGDHQKKSTKKCKNTRMAT